MAERIVHSNQYRVYKPTLRARVMLVIRGLFNFLTVGVTGFAATVFLDVDLKWLVLVMYFGILSAQGVYFLLASRHMRLVFSDEVIEFHTFGYSIIGSWHSVESIANRQRGRELVEYLVFSQCRMVGGRWWVHLVTFNLHTNKAIPLSDFGDWRIQDIRCELQRVFPNTDTPSMIAEQKAKDAKRKRDEVMTDHLEDIFGSIANPTKRRIPRR